MYKNILIATDGSELADRAVQHGLSLARELNAKVTVVMVTDIWAARDMAARTESGETDAIEHYEEFQAALAEKVLTKAENTAKDIGIQFECVHVKDKYPAEGIIDTADSKSVDLIVMGSHGLRGMMRALLGSVASEVVSRSSVPVLVHR